jgi:hypothetical protein
LPSLYCSAFAFDRVLSLSSLLLLPVAHSQ